MAKYLRSWWPQALIATALIVLLAVALWWFWPQQNSGQNAESQSSSIEEPTLPGTTADESDKARPGSWQLVINDINLSAQVDEVGLTADGIMNAPDSIYRVGLFNGTARPGETGTIVLAGHYGGTGNKQGVFNNLKNLNQGDEIAIKNTNQKWHYRVVDQRSYVTSEVPVQDIFDNSQANRLVLITCAGKFDKNINQYTERRIVYAQAI